MTPKIYYVVKAKLILKKKENNEFDFLEINEEFRNDEPIVAREAAFKYYQNYIDVLLQAKGIVYRSDKQARTELESFHDPKTTSKIEIMSSIHESSDAMGNGIGVIMKYVEPLYTGLNTIDQYLIHGIGNFWDCNSDDPDSIMDSLSVEYNVYEENNYNTGNYETSVVFCNCEMWLDPEGIGEGYRDLPTETYKILKTPFDWSGMDKPYWWGGPRSADETGVQNQNSYTERTWEEIIACGESNQVEFKPALLYNFLSKKAGIGIKGIIAKSICGFLNANGGYLFIGMNDNGTPQGLSHDFSLSGEKAPRDYFSLEFDDMIKQFLPQAMSNIHGKFITVDATEIFVAIVFPSKSKPVFMNGKDGKEFWVRWTASTRQIVDAEEIVNYCLEHWNNLLKP